MCLDWTEGGPKLPVFLLGRGFPPAPAAPNMHLYLERGRGVTCEGSRGPSLQPSQLQMPLPIDTCQRERVPFQLPMLIDHKQHIGPSPAKRFDMTIPRTYNTSQKQANDPPCRLSIFQWPYASWNPCSTVETKRQPRTTGDQRWRRGAKALPQ